MCRDRNVCFNWSSDSSSNITCTLFVALRSYALLWCYTILWRIYASFGDPSAAIIPGSCCPAAREYPVTLWTRFRLTGGELESDLQNLAGTRVPAYPVRIALPKEQRSKGITVVLDDWVKHR